MALIDSYNLQQQEEFQQRVLAALVTAAVAIMGEDPNAAYTGATHAQRVAFALRVLADPVTQARIVGWGVASNSVLAGEYATQHLVADISDNDLQFSINSVVDWYAQETA